MASRYVYKAILYAPYVKAVKVDFKFYNGFSLSQKRASITSLHSSYLRAFPNDTVLEVSSKSESRLGVALSAFNLTLNTSKQSISVENAFQSSKVFEYGGPYKDLLDVSPRDAKRDSRLTNSGRLVSFQFNGKEYPINPPDMFYTWLYCNILFRNPTLLEAMANYDAFTDIEFNPKRSINCQAISAARCCSLYRINLLQQALSSIESFREILYSDDTGAVQGEQLLLF